MNKIAFLILAHTDPKQLQRTIKSLDNEHFDIYVHIDRKKKIEEFQLDEIELKHSRIVLVKNRKKVIWGDISIVDATLELYRTAHKNDNYVRYVTISGLDYPILSNERLWNTLSQMDTEFIGGGAD